MDSINFSEFKDFFSEYAPGYFVHGLDRTDEVILVLFVLGFFILFALLVISLYDLKRNK